MGTVTTRPEVTAALLLPVPGPVGTSTEGIVGFRRAVSRFANGEEHARRREVVVDVLSGVDPEDLRVAMRADPHRSPVAVLAEALGLPGEVEGDILTVAAAYHPGTGPEPPADAALARLLPLVARSYSLHPPAEAGSGPPEGGWNEHERAVAVAVVTVLVQAVPTGALAQVAGRHRGLGATRAVEAALREEPPVRVTRRRGPEGEVLVDLAAAQADGGEVLVFGAGPRGCPGRRHAIAMAEGAVER